MHAAQQQQGAFTDSIWRVAAITMQVPAQSFNDTALNPMLLDPMLLAAVRYGSMAMDSEPAVSGGLLLRLLLSEGSCVPQAHIASTCVLLYGVDTELAFMLASPLLTCCLCRLALPRYLLAPWRQML